MRTKLILERLDKDYRLLERKEQLSRSFVRNFISLLYLAHAQISDGGYTITDITGNARAVDSRSIAATAPRVSKPTLMIGAPPGYSAVFCFGGYGDATSIAARLDLTKLEGSKIGIQVGTGVAVVTPPDAALDTRINHGRGAGELQYGGCELVNMVFADPNGEFTIRRYLSNASGGGITVNEVGIYSVASRYSTALATTVPYIFCIFRDVVAPVTVNDTEILRVSILPQITV